MSSEEIDVMEKLRALSVAAAHELLAGVDRLKSLSEEMRGDDATNADRAAKTRSRGIAYEFARTELEHAEKLLSLTHSQADLLFEHARSLLRSTRGAGSAPAAAVVKLVTDPVTHRASASFSVRNPFGEQADARFEVEAFKTSGDAPAAELAGALQISPAPQRVAPRASAKVQLDVHADVAPGVYFGKLVVYFSADVERLVTTRLIKLCVGRP